MNLRAILLLAAFGVPSLAMRIIEGEA